MCFSKDISAVSNYKNDLRDWDGIKNYKKKLFGRNQGVRYVVFAFSQSKQLNNMGVFVYQTFLSNVFRSESGNLSNRFWEEHLTKTETDRQPEERTVNTEFIGPFPSGVQKLKKNRDTGCFYYYFTQLTTLWEHSQITSTYTFDMGKEGSKLSKMGWRNFLTSP